MSTTAATLLTGGAAPALAGNIYGIRGNDRPGTDAYYSIGADEADSIFSLTLGGSSYPVRPWPAPSIGWSVKWMRDAAGYANGSDRGASQDAYESTVLFQGRETLINSLEQGLDLYREAIVLSGFAFPLFAPNVDHTGSINATVLSIERTQLQWGYPYTTHQIYQLEVKFRAIAPTLLATTPSLATLHLQDRFTASHSYESRKAFTMAQTAAYADHRNDTGVFEGVFSQTTAQTQAILAYILVTARANAVAFPAALSAVVPYPWGRTRGAPTNCKITAFELSRKNLNRWTLKIKFEEAP